MSDDLPEVSQDALLQFEKIRESGKCNMFDARCIKDAATAWGFTAIVEFIDANPAKWHRAIAEQYEAYDPTLNNLFGWEGAEGVIRND